MLDLERRAISAFVALGVAMTDTCINYQTIQAPTRNEHVAFGDTGVVIYSNSICGARSNFEGGPSALAAGLTGRTPRYGFHLREQRRATLHVRVDVTPASLNEWGALGGVIGRLAGHYWAVPVIEGVDKAPRSDELKHFGAAMASFGSIALFHLAGLTPEAERLSDVAEEALPTHRVGQTDIDALQRSFRSDDLVDVMVFSAPQLSLYELRDLAELCDDRRFLVPLLAVTSPQVKPDCDRMGYTARVERPAATYCRACASISPMHGRSRRPWLASARDQQRQTGEHIRRIRLSANAGIDEECVEAAITGKVV